MELHEVIEQKFGGMQKNHLRTVIMAMSPCEDGVKWFDEEFNGDFSAVPMHWLSWFARLFLRRADLSEANLRRADLSGADLYGAYLTGAYLTGAEWDKYTKWPDGFTHPTPARSTSPARGNTTTEHHRRQQ